MAMAGDTVFSSLLSGNHGRERRLERNIEKIDLQRAKLYGMKEPSFKNRIKSTYGGIVFVYDQKNGREVTSFPSRDLASETSGTKCVKAVVLPMHSFGNEANREISHKRHLLVKRIIATDKTKWNSHSVFVIDMSGSMRRDDVSGARCRSDGVWMVLARDFVKKHIDEGTATDLDVVSIVLMRDTAEVILKFQPLDWMLYNTLIALREWTLCRPQGAGNYLPALDMAEALLEANTLGTCALALLFFSDGKPSDHGPFAEKVGEIATKYRRRLTFCCIGMAEETDFEAFETMREMVTEADAYGAKSTFNLPSLDTESLSHIISSMSSSLCSTKTEMTALTSGETRVVRNDIRSERKGTLDDLHLTDKWRVYSEDSQSNFVIRIWSWSPEAGRNGDFIQLRDSRCIFCYKECIDVPRNVGYWCRYCKAMAYCQKCLDKFPMHADSWECQDLSHDMKTGMLIARAVPSFSVAMKVPIFGEGAERVVRKFRYLDQDGNFIGPKMVAKESRFIDPCLSSYTEERTFHANFMRTQALASKYAKMFNKALDSLPDHLACFHRPLFVSHFPRIEFVEPMVVEVSDKGEESNILIELLLEGKYEKFNNNAGYVKGQHHVSQENVDVLNDFGLLDGPGIIEEGDEDEDEDSQDEGFDEKDFKPDTGEYVYVEDFMFPQAFSHYSFEKSMKKFMVVDLQGVFQRKSDGTRKYLLTDPAIHRNWRISKNHSTDFGRTDRGQKGMKAFFQTHNCTDVCRLLGLQKVDPRSLLCTFLIH